MCYLWVDFLHGVCPFNDSSDSIISRNGNLCHQTLGVWGKDNIVLNVYNDYSTRFSTSVSADFIAVTTVQLQGTVEDLTSVMAHLSEGLQLRRVSCKWLARLSSQVFWVDWFMTPWIVFSYSLYGQDTGRPAMGLVWLSLSSPHSATRLPPNPQASSIMESINLTIQAT